MFRYMVLWRADSSVPWGHGKANLCQILWQPVSGKPKILDENIGDPFSIVLLSSPFDFLRLFMIRIGWIFGSCGMTVTDWNWAASAEEAYKATPMIRSRAGYYTRPIAKGSQLSDWIKKWFFHELLRLVIGLDGFHPLLVEINLNTVVLSPRLDGGSVFDHNSHNPLPNHAVLYHITQNTIEPSFTRDLMFPPTPYCTFVLIAYPAISIHISSREGAVYRTVCERCCRKFLHMESNIPGSQQHFIQAWDWKNFTRSLFFMNQWRWCKMGKTVWKVRTEGLNSCTIFVAWSPY